MKKIVVGILFCIFLFPISTMGKSNITIQTDVSVEGKELEEGEFSFVLKDKDGNVLQTKKNNADGNVIFDSIGVDDVSEEVNTIYSIEELNPKKIGYTYDDNVVYVRVNAKPNTEAQVYYYKNHSIEEEMKKEIVKYDAKEPYHATEEELKGDAYAVLDLNAETLYFRRFEQLDNSSFRYPFDNPGSSNPDMAIDTENRLVYFRNVENNKSLFTGSLSYCVSDKCPRKVVFEDAFKPSFEDGTYLFQSLKYYANEVDFSHFDSSNLKTMDYMFYSISNISKLDLSTFETSQVSSMLGMFKESKFEEIDFTSFSGESLENISYMFAFCSNLKELKISSRFSSEKLLNAEYFLYNTISLLTLDLSWLNLKYNTSAYYLCHGSGLKYVDLSHLNFVNGENGTISVFSSSFGSMPNLVYFDISNLKSSACGASGSADFNLSDSVRVIKISQSFNVSYSMSYIDQLFYNVSNNTFTNELSNQKYCQYYMGGDYIKILDDTTSFHNTYQKVIQPLSHNPLTGFLISFVCITIFTLSIVFITIHYKRKA